MKKHISLFLAAAFITSTISAMDQNNAAEIAKTTGSIALHAGETVAGLGACALAAVLTTAHTGLHLVNIGKIEDINDPENMEFVNGVTKTISHAHKTSGITGAITATAGATAVFHGVKGLVKDFKKIMQLALETKEEQKTNSTPEQSLTKSKKVARLALHTAQLIGGIGTAGLGALVVSISALFKPVSHKVVENFVKNTEKRKDARKTMDEFSAFAKYGVGAGAVIGTAGIATMVHAAKGLYNDYKTL